MKLDARALVVPLVAVAVLALAVQQTLSALRASGSWQPRRNVPRNLPQDPYTRIDRLLASTGKEPPARPDDPFAYGHGRLPEVVRSAPRPAVKRPPPVAAVPRPTLTSIVWDADPWATVRYDGRDFSVRQNSLFADFRVKTISRTQVVLDQRGGTIVLTLRPKGD